MTMVNVTPAPLCFAGIPVQRWFYATRIWIATVVALATAFWLQLDGASTAAVTVSILALQTHGQTFQKSGYRLAATCLGIVASIAIADWFSQAPDLYVIAVAIWLAVCVFAAGMFDGNRAYGAVLAGYTVCIVAVLQIDTPQNVFLAGISRGAAIAVAIAALAVVNTLMGASSVYAGLELKLLALRSDLKALALEALHGGAVSAPTTAELMGRLTALHPEITALYLESARGRQRGQAARKLVTALVMEIEAVYALNFVPSAEEAQVQLADQRSREIAQIFQTGNFSQIKAARARVAISAAFDPSDFVATALKRLLDAELSVAEALTALRSDCQPARSTRLRLYRSRRMAAWNACRVMLAMMVIGIIVSRTNWPATSTIYGFAGVIAGLGASTSNVRMFSKFAFTGAPIAAAMVGVIQFLVLGGGGQFELLALALAPATIGAALLQSSPEVPRSVFGFIVLVYLPMILAPSNPESFNPETYLLTSVFTMLAAGLVYASLIVFPPPSESRRLRWMITDAREDARRALQGPTTVAIEADAFRDADRIGQIGAASEQLGTATAGLEEALLLAETASAARAAHIAVARSQVCGAAARSALAALNGADLRDEAKRALSGVPRDSRTICIDHASAAALFWMAALADRRPFANAEREMQT
jgi:uncharacterized membrane protein YccC